MVLHSMDRDPENLQLVELAVYQLPDDEFTPQNACLYMEQIFGMSELEVEHIYFMCVDDQNRILSVYLNGIGNEIHCENETAPLAIYLLLSKAAGFAMFHNHPNRIWQASQDDIESNETLQKIADAMNVKYLGSFIVGDMCYVKVGDPSIEPLPI